MKRTIFYWLTPVGWLLGMACAAAQSHAIFAITNKNLAKPFAAISAQSLQYQSIFLSYIPFSEKNTAWLAANQTVQKNGGWRFYALEAQAEQSELNHGVEQGVKP